MYFLRHFILSNKFAFIEFQPEGTILMQFKQKQNPKNSCKCSEQNEFLSSGTYFFDKNIQKRILTQFISSYNQISNYIVGGEITELKYMNDINIYLIIHA